VLNASPLPYLVEISQGPKDVISDVNTKKCKTGGTKWGSGSNEAIKKERSNHISVWS